VGGRYLKTVVERLLPSAPCQGLFTKQPVDEH